MANVRLNLILCSIKTAFFYWCRAVIVEEFHVSSTYSVIFVCMSSFTLSLLLSHSCAHCKHPMYHQDFINVHFDYYHRLHYTCIHIVLQHLVRVNRWKRNEKRAARVRRKVKLLIYFFNIEWYSFVSMIESQIMIIVHIKHHFACAHIKLHTYVYAIQCTMYMLLLYRFHTIKAE